MDEELNIPLDISEILKKTDHTLLSPSATLDDYKRLADEGIRYGVASVCIPPSLVSQIKEYVGGRVKICTVIGFPCGYSTRAAKVYEAMDAVECGADEIDMVINIGLAKEGRFDEITEEIRAVRRVTEGTVLKVIIETCLLCREEKIALCKCVSEAGADYIKTSTGFSSGGATPEDVALLRANVAEGVRVKAAGGIRSFDDAREFLSLGADRLGTSRLVALAKGAEGSGY